MDEDDPQAHDHQWLPDYEDDQVICDRCLVCGLAWYTDKT